MEESTLQMTVFILGEGIIGSVLKSVGVWSNTNLCRDRTVYFPVALVRLLLINMNALNCHGSRHTGSRTWFAGALTVLC